MNGLAAKAAIFLEKPAPPVPPPVSLAVETASRVHAADGLPAGPLAFVDTHTAGEPTRVFPVGALDLGGGSLAERRTRFGDRFGRLREAMTREPRGSDVLVGAVLTEPTAAGRARGCVAGVVFFNNVGPLLMCGHGTIGVAAALVHSRQIGLGEHRLETPVGDVPLVVTEAGQGGATARLTNVPAYRAAKDVPVRLADGRQVVGDVAWGGNWFYLVDAASHGEAIEAGNISRLMELSREIKAAIGEQGIAGAGGGEIDHIELCGPLTDADHAAGDLPSDTPGGRNFVLCPGDAFDRSPCGTGTSAKLACLAADGKLAAGEPWRQVSVIGSQFVGEYQPVAAADRPAELENVAEPVVRPQVTGQAFVTAEGTFHFPPADPFRGGIAFA